MDVMDTNMLNFALFLVDGMRHVSPYKTGNMRSNITLVNVDNNHIDIIINVDYASYVNEQKKHFHWINKAIENYAKAFSQNNIVEDKDFTLNATITYGNKQGG